MEGGGRTRGEKLRYTGVRMKVHVFFLRRNTLLPLVPPAVMEEARPPPRRINSGLKPRRTHTPADIESLARKCQCLLTTPSVSFLFQLTALARGLSFRRGAATGAISNLATNLSAGSRPPERIGQQNFLPRHGCPFQRNSISREILIFLLVTSSSPSCRTAATTLSHFTRYIVYW